MKASLTMKSGLTMKAGLTMKSGLTMKAGPDHESRAPVRIANRSGLFATTKNDNALT